MYATRNDWGQTVMKDMVDIDLNMKKLDNMNKNQLRKYVKDRIEAIAFNYLTEKNSPIKK